MWGQLLNITRNLVRQVRFRDLPRHMCEHANFHFLRLVSQPMPCLHSAPFPEQLPGVAEISNLMTL